jgi:hypothetical protein
MVRRAFHGERTGGGAPVTGSGLSDVCRFVGNEQDGVQHMSDENGETRYPPGRQPYDPLNGFRVGALFGGIIGVLPAAILGPYTAVTMVGGAAIGGAVGYWWEKRTMTPR